MHNVASIIRLTTLAPRIVLTEGGLTENPSLVPGFLIP